MTRASAHPAAGEEISQGTNSMEKHLVDLGDNELSLS